MIEPTFDTDGYPTEESLKAIKEWDLIEGDAGVYPKVHALLDFVEKLWSYPDRFCWNKTTNYSWVYTEFPSDRKYKIKSRKLYMSTGGWSGNESVIGALEQNFIFWAMYWWKHERGGHYWFEIPESKKYLAQPTQPNPDSAEQGDRRGNK